MNRRHDARLTADQDDGLAASNDLGNNLGRQIYKLRQAHSLPLRTVSQRTGVSAAMLSLIERGRSNPSIGTLQAIADALNVPMSELFHAAERAGPSSSDVVRAQAQEVIETADGVTRRLLVSDPTRGFEMTENRYGPGTATSSAPVHHHGIEFGFVLEGELEVTIGDRVHLLRSGDAVHLNSVEPHMFRNTGKHPARTIWVNLGAEGTCETTDGMRPHRQVQLR